MDVEYQIISDIFADIFENINISHLTMALAKEGCEVLSLKERDETLESYYMNLIEGGRLE